MKHAAALTAMLVLTVVGSLVGCGTTRWSDTARTATEQLLVSDCIDRSVSAMDLRALAGKKVYFDTTYIRTTIDADYITSSIRQHALASGCIVKTVKDDADYIAEIRSGAVGTDRYDVLFGVPATSLPTGTPGMAATIPELPFIKKTDQRAVAKLAVFAYNRRTGRPIWQSGITPVESEAKDVWVFGAGPFKKGDIHKGMNFAGDRLPIPTIEPGNQDEAQGLGKKSVAAEAYFTEPNEPVELARRDSIFGSAVFSTASTGAGDTATPPPGPATAATSVSSGSPFAIGTSTPPAAPPATGPNGEFPPVQTQGGFLNQGQMPALQWPAQLPSTLKH